MEILPLPTQRGDGNEGKDLPSFAKRTSGKTLFQKRGGSLRADVAGVQELVSGSVEDFGGVTEVRAIAGPDVSGVLNHVGDTADYES